MRRLRMVVGQESGIAMIIVVVMTVVLATLAVGLIDVVGNESTRSAHSVWSEGSFQAAEAGIDDYVSKLDDDHIYYLHYVNQAESTRSPSAGVTVSPVSPCPFPKTSTGTTWGYSKTWTYPNGEDHWCDLPNGYQYNLEIFPPGSAQNTTTSVRIVATGRKAGSTTDMRAIETYVHPSNLADFYRFSDGDVSIDAETFGKIYSNGNVNHTGTAHADIFAEGSITGNPTMVDGAQKYANGAFPANKIKNHPIDFSKFLVSLDDIKRAATSGGVYLFQSGVTSWKIIFKSDGTFTAAPCTGGATPEVTAPTCTAATTHAVPANGAIYTDVTAIVSGSDNNGFSVNGRVTVGAGNDIVVAGNIGPVTSGDDVLGLVASSDLWVAAYAPDQLTWNASVLVETNTWHSAGSNRPAGSHMDFTGSSATAVGGSFSQYDTRTYSYDPALQYLPPPWFPAVDDTVSVSFFREVHP